MEADTRASRILNKRMAKALRLCRVIFIAGCVLVSLPLLAVLLYLFDIFCLLHGSYCLLLASVKKTRSIYNKVVVGRTKPADVLPADILVRASEKPRMGQQDILLRAVIDPQDTPVDQLLRPTERA